MPTSVTGNSTRPLAINGGFSLIELLVVLLLIGIILTMATLAIRPGLGAADGDDESARLAALLQLAREQAVLQGDEHGLELSSGGYQLLMLRDRAWEPLTDPVWRPRILPPELRLRLTVEGRAVDLPDTAEGEPQLLLFSSGEMTPFTLEIEGMTTVCLLAGDGLADLPPPKCEPV
jgi:general secretion pathway protein H